MLALDLSNFAAEPTQITKHAMRMTEYCMCGCVFAVVPSRPRSPLRGRCAQGTARTYSPSPSFSGFTTDTSMSMKPEKWLHPFPKALCHCVPVDEECQTPERLGEEEAGNVNGREPTGPPLQAVFANLLRQGCGGHEASACQGRGCGKEEEWGEHRTFNIERPTSKRDKRIRGRGPMPPPLPPLSRPT